MILRDGCPWQAGGQLGSARDKKGIPSEGGVVPKTIRAAICPSIALSPQSPQSTVHSADRPVRTKRG